MTTPERDTTIMVIDDTPANLKLLEGMLKNRGYRVRPFPRGRLGLAAAVSDPPDLILLDIMMPEMDGYSVCAQLKEDELTRDIPVIFLSALNEESDKVQAFRSGGVDYVSKPIQFEELVARVETHLSLKRLQDELRNRNRELQSSIEKTQELEKLRDNLVHMMVHDMRSPVMAMRGNMELFRMEVEDSVPSDNLEMLDSAIGSADALADMISAMLDVSRLEEGKMPLETGSCNLMELSAEAMSQLNGLTKGRILHFEPSEVPVTVAADPNLTRRVIGNLLGNALKFTPKGGRIDLRVEDREGRATVLVQDTGPGIPREFHQTIFDKFGQAESRSENIKHSTGLGLTFCKLAIEAMGGSIGLDSEPGQGSTFWFQLPPPLPAPE